MTGAATECRFEAASLLTRTKPFADDEGGNTRGAVLVDVLRRAGRFDAADAECRELLGRAGVQGVVRQVLEAQRRFIANRDAAPHTVAEATRSP
jgi:ribosomal protein S28E/S33